MNARTLFAAVSVALLLASGTAQSQEQVGRVKFANSCDPGVQPLLETAVAMLHSFWFGAGEKTFRAVLAQDPSCTIANWGIAAILMSNPLAAERSKGAAAQLRSNKAAVSPRNPRARLHRGGRGVL
jgi:hypothetical protein